MGEKVKRCTGLGPANPARQYAATDAKTAEPPRSKGLLSGLFRQAGNYAAYLILRRAAVRASASVRTRA